MGGQTLLRTLLILAIIHQSAYKLCRFSCTFILFFDVFVVSAVRILLLSNFCKLLVNYMQQEESVDLCSIVESLFCPIVDYDHNLSSPEVIFIVMMIFLPLLFLPIGRVECTLFLIFRKALFSVGTSSFKEPRMVSSKTYHIERSLHNFIGRATT